MRSPTLRLGRAPRVLIPVLTASFALVLAAASTGQPERPASPPAPAVPTSLPPPQADGVIYLPDPSGTPRATTLDADLQQRLTAFIEDSNRPIAAVAVVDVKTGAVLALAQGRAPEEWGGKTHTALHTGFPAASLFKTVVTAAAFEVGDVEAAAESGLSGGCANVRATGEWQAETTAPARSRRARGDQMSLRRAYGASCNGFFAKVAVNELGLGIITEFARRLGWEHGVPTDFALERSPFHPPSVHNSSTHLVGRFAAGFGNVGISAVHAAWISMVTAHDGRSVPLRLFRDTPPLVEVPPAGAAGAGAAGTRLFSADTAAHLREVMDATPQGGTGNHVFSPRGRYRKLRDVVGGKTGTLTGASPKGLTTLFSGLAPLNAPEIAVASVVILDGRWKIKATTLAAEAMHLYFEKKTQAASLDTAAAPLAASPERARRR